MATYEEKNVAMEVEDHVSDLICVATAFCQLMETLWLTLWAKSLA
jgi:hypothetical protein